MSENSRKNDASDWLWRKTITATAEFIGGCFVLAANLI